MAEEPMINELLKPFIMAEEPMINEEADDAKLKMNNRDSHRRSTFIRVSNPLVEDDNSDADSLVGSRSSGGSERLAGEPGTRLSGRHTWHMRGRSARGSMLGIATDFLTGPEEPIDVTIEAKKVFRYSTLDARQSAIGDGTTLQSMMQETLSSEDGDEETPLDEDKEGVDYADTGKPTADVYGKERLTPWISYELFQWTLFLVITVLAIVDRFAWNVWPRQTYSIGAGSAGGDRTEGYKPGPWSVVLYDCLARVSGRYSIICYNFILITRLECLEHLLTSSFVGKYVSKYLLDTSNIINANLRLHFWNGIGLCVMTILHIWSILFPCVTHGYSAVMVPGVFEWPISERTPVKCSKSDEPGCWPGDANPELKQMGLQADDVFRMVEMTVFLVILMPISVRWFASRWHAGIQLHRIINLVYFVDIVRRHSHPHSWILNTPVFVVYLIDAYVFRYYFHRNKSPEIKRVKLGNDFMVLYWKSPFGITDTVGPDYGLLMNNSSFLEEKHLFTCFENRSGSCLGDDADGFDWTVGVVIRVFRHPRVPRLSIKDSKSHTQRMFEEEPNMLIMGPRQGEMSEKVRLELLTKCASPLILFGAGSAVNFIIDTLEWCSTNKPNRSQISIVYTTRDYNLFQWAMESFSNLLPLCEDRGILFEVKMAFTGSFENEALEPTQHTEDPENSTKESMEKTERTIVSLISSVKTQPMRVDLNAEIAPKSTVFCQGSDGLKRAVDAVCRNAGARFYGGRGGAREDLL